MTTKETLIAQAEAAVRVAKRKVQAGQWKEITIFQAQDKLNALVNSYQVPEVRKTTSFGSSGLNSAQPPVFSSSQMSQAVNARPLNLMDESRQLVSEAQEASRRLAGLSNLIHCTDGTEKVALLKQIGVANMQKEQKWSEYFYFKRNGKRMEVLAVEHKKEAEYLNNPEFLRLERDKNSLMQKRSRYKGRLERDVLSDKQRIEIEESFSKTDMEISALVERIKQLKYG
jgi:hypothetical protein